MNADLNLRLSAFIRGRDLTPFERGSKGHRRHNHTKRFRY
jgi:hypothetical protein